MRNIFVNIYVKYITNLHIFTIMTNAKVYEYIQFKTNI